MFSTKTGVFLRKPDMVLLNHEITRLVVPAARALQDFRNLFNRILKNIFRRHVNLRKSNSE